MLPADSLDLAATLQGLGTCELKQDQFAQAQCHLLEALGIREKKQPTDWSRFELQSLLGAALAGQERYAEAEPILVGGYEGLVVHENEIPKWSKNAVTDALDHLIRLYDAWGKPEKAAEWREKLLKTEPPPANPPKP
jgi:hypothetical protein